MTFCRHITAASKLITELHGGHIPVMVKEILEILDPKDDNVSMVRQLNSCSRHLLVLVITVLHWFIDLIIPFIIRNLNG